jgi:hypothetical protein
MRGQTDSRFLLHNHARWYLTLLVGCRWLLPQVNEYRYEIERLTRELQVGTLCQPNQATLSLQPCQPSSPDLACCLWGPPPTQKAANLTTGVDCACECAGAEAPVLRAEAAGAADQGSGTGTRC